MMTILSKLTNDELFVVLNSNKLDELKHILDPQKARDIIKAVNQLQIKHSNDTICQSLLSALTEGPNYPLYVLGTLLGLIHIAFLPLTIITTIIVSSMILTGMIFICATHKELKKKQAKRLNSYALMRLD